ncbi:MAG: phospho-N-acetylmuramoyl-pentapeptide-transferase, partial [Ilumatobacteraceae bacterium]
MIAVMVAGTTAMIVSLFGTRFLITFFRDRGKGQPILGKEDHGPDHHQYKAGTPTMGGLAIVAAALFGWLVAHGRTGLVFSDQALVIWGGVLVMGFMGFLDDYIKVSRARNRGIFWKRKGYITFALSLGIAWILVSTTSVSQNVSITRSTLPGWHLPWYVWVVYAALIIWSTSNAVNVTDGLDGLAGGSALLGFLAFT